MARIRNLKPDFWTDEKLVELEPWERLLFIGLWNFADDQGYLPFSPKRIKMQIFPGDSLEVSRGLQSLISINALTLYDSVEGQVIQVTNWHKHQKVSNPSRSKYDDLDLELMTLPKQKPRKHAEVAPEILEDYTNSTEDSRGLHKEREREGGMEREGVLKSSCSPTPSSSVRFPEFWAAYPRKTGKRTAATKFEAAAKRGGADAVIDGALRLAQDPNLPETQYIPHPTTWLARDGWEDEPLPPKFTTGSDQRLARGYQMTQNLSQYEPPSNEFPEIEPDDYQRELEQ